MGIEMSERPEAKGQPPAKVAKPDECGGPDDWKKFSIVTEHHELLHKYFLGTFNYKVEFFMDPTSDPMVSGGTSTYTSILGGRFVEGIYQGEAGVFGPVPFEGKDIVGYDSFHSQYICLWFDNMTTVPMHTTGSYDEATRTITTFGEYPIFMEGTGMAKMKTETVFPEDLSGPNVYNLYKGDQDGNFQLQMRVTSTRSTEKVVN